MLLKYTRCLLYILLCVFAGQTKDQVITADILESKIQQLGEYILYRNHDTTYIKNYADNFAIKQVAVNKYTYFQFLERNKQSKLIYRPEYRVHHGI